MPGQVRDRHGLAALIFPLALGYGDTLPLAFQQVCPLKLVDCRDHGHQQLSRGGAGVDTLLVAHQGHALFPQNVQQVQQVLCASGDTGQVMDINGISLPDPIQHFLKLRAVRVLAAGLFDKPFINPPDG